MSGPGYVPKAYSGSSFSVASVAVIRGQAGYRGGGGVGSPPGMTHAALVPG